MMFSQTHGTWGERIRTFSWSGGIVTLLWLRPWQRCSRHKHKTAYNRFICVEGAVYIWTDKGYETKLGPKQMFDVEPGIEHEFRTREEGAVIEEIAYTQYDQSDIDRRLIGGEFKEPNE